MNDTALIPIANAATPHANDFFLGSRWNLPTRLFVAICLSCTSGSLNWNLNSVLSSSSSSLVRFNESVSINGASRSAFNRSINSFCSAMSCDIFGRAISTVSASSSTTVSSDPPGVVTSTIRTDRADDLITLGDFGTGERGTGDRDLAGDFAERGIGTGAGLFVRADRRGGGKVEGGRSAAGTGEDSLLRLEVGSTTDGDGVGRLLVAAGDDLGAALGVVFVDARR